MGKVGLPRARQRAGRPGPKNPTGPGKTQPALCRVLAGYINCQVDFFNLSNKLGKTELYYFSGFE